MEALKNGTTGDNERLATHLLRDERACTHPMDERSIELLSRVTHPGEEILFCIAGLRVQYLVGYSHRIVILKTVQLGARLGRKIESFDYARITGIHRHTRGATTFVEIESEDTAGTHSPGDRVDGPNVLPVSTSKRPI